MSVARWNADMADCVAEAIGARTAEPAPVSEYESTAAAAAFRRSRRVAQVLLGIEIELLFAFGPAEIIGLPFVLASSHGGRSFYFHPAHRIFRSCCGFHTRLSFAR